MPDASKLKCVQPHFQISATRSRPREGPKPLPRYHTITSASNTILEGGRLEGGYSTWGCGRIIHRVQDYCNHFGEKNRGTAVEVRQEFVSIADSAKTIPGKMCCCGQCNMGAPGRDNTITREAKRTAEYTTPVGRRLAKAPAATAVRNVAGESEKVRAQSLHESRVSHQAEWC